MPILQMKKKGNAEGLNFLLKKTARYNGARTATDISGKTGPCLCQSEENMHKCREAGYEFLQFYRGLKLHEPTS